MTEAAAAAAAAATAMTTTTRGVTAAGLMMMYGWIRSSLRPLRETDLPVTELMAPSRLPR